MTSVDRILARAAFLTILPVALCVPALAAQAGWRTFVNPRFDYSICFPADLRESGPPPDNGDGRVFRNTAGVELRVWGQYNALEDTIPSALERNRGYLREDGIQVTYEAKGRDWFVLSGKKGTTLFYQRTRWSRDRFVTFQLTYPEAAKARWNPLIAKITACSHDTEPATP